MKGKVAVLPSSDRGHLGLTPAGRASEEIGLRMMSGPEASKAPDALTQYELDGLHVISEG